MPQTDTETLLINFSAGIKPLCSELQPNTNSKTNTADIRESTRNKKHPENGSVAVSDANYEWDPPFFKFGGERKGVDDYSWIIFEINLVLRRLRRKFGRVQVGGRWLLVLIGFLVPFDWLWTTTWQKVIQQLVLNNYLSTNCDPRFHRR